MNNKQSKVVFTPNYEKAKFLPISMLRRMLWRDGKMMDNYAVGMIGRNHGVLPCEMPLQIGGLEIGRVICYNRAAFVKAAREEGWDVK